MGKQILFLVLLFSVSISARAAIYHDPGLDWFTLETEHFYLHFHNGAESLTRKFSPAAEQIHKDISGFLNWQPKAKTHVVLSDEYDVSNGFATVFPRNVIVLYLSAPDSPGALEDHLGWLEMVFVHEYLHIVHMDKSHSIPFHLQSVFGRYFFLFPNTRQPNWIIEGLATYAETDQKLGTGRGQSSYFNMLMRMDVATGVKPLRQVNQKISSWPAGHTPYLYGVNFFNYIRETYGEEKITQQVEDFSGNIIPYRTMSNIHNVYGIDIDSIWQDFVSYLENKHKPVLADVRVKGILEGQRLTHSGYYVGQLRSNGEQLFFYEYDGASHPAVYLLDEKHQRQKVSDLHSSARLNLQTKKNILVAQPEWCRNTNLFYDLYIIKSISHEQKRLTQCGRYRYAVWSSDGQAIFAVKNKLGNNSLVRLNRQGEVQKIIWSWKQGEQVGYLSRAPSADRLVMSIWRPTQGWDLAILDINNSSLIYLTEDSAIQQHPIYTSHGNAILFSADYDGIYNIYRLDLDNGTLVRLTNVRGGAFYPVIHKGRLYYSGYTSDGFDIFMIDTLRLDSVRHAVKLPLEEDKADIKSTPDTAMNRLSNKGTYNTSDDIKNYSSLQSLGLSWWFPYMFTSEHRSEYGITTSSHDVLKRHSFNTTIVHDVDNGLWLGNIFYQYDGWYPNLSVGLNRNNSIELDVNGSISRIRNRDDMIVELVFPYRSHETEVSFHIAASNQHSYDYTVKPAAPYLGDTQNNDLGLAWRYNTAKKYALSISPVDGRDVRLIYEDSDVIGNSDNKGQVFVADWREFVGLGGNQVLALRYVEGLGENDSTRFKLGGIQSRYGLVDALLGNGGAGALFNVRNYSLRGYNEGNPQLNARNMRLLSAEYRFPLWLVERGWMAPPIGIHRINGTVFYDVGGVWQYGTSPEVYYAGTGLEINAELDMFYSNRMQLSIGYAEGLDNVQGYRQFYLYFGIVF